MAEGAVKEALHDAPSVCWVCCEGDSDEPLLPTGCACRGSGGQAHLSCLVQAAEHDINTWTLCPTCRQHFTGIAEIGLARARWAKVRDRPEEDPERLFVANNLAVTLMESAGDPEKALELLEMVLAVRRRTLGDDHPDTLDSITNLALHHTEMGRYAEALPLSEEVVTATLSKALQQGSDADEDDDELLETDNWDAAAASGDDDDEDEDEDADEDGEEGKCDEARRRPSGKWPIQSEEAAHALTSLAVVHNLMGNHELARAMHHDVLCWRETVLGRGHLDTFNSMHGLGQALVWMEGRREEGLAMLDAAAAAARMVLGAEHPSTKHFARNAAAAAATASAGDGAASGAAG